ncbi:uncharacterized protein LOC132717615 [Ruditapes philippinarum]|uniref:uncharacterized protein LOC132717615 n=1 Tax=Ruditapes philippinarum TaxID=129788 RepID=UPI00295B767A|nr:uncharacterized protein LOC132717615 [Ruditapes philippinarum]XP_060557094.1 uncharacterized protein LOC132717615 [Ruditapes philippinarum]
MAESKTIQEAESKGSDDVFDMYCEACHREGQHEIACAFCSACVTYFCSTCLKYHGKFYPFHKTLEGNKMPQDLCLEKCETHTKEVVKYFCTTCNKFVCCICKPELHKDTCNMSYLPDFVTDTKCEEELKGLMKHKDGIVKHLSDFTGEIDTRYESIFVDTAETRTVIKKEKELMFAKFEEEISTLEETIQTKKESDTLSIDKAKERLELLQKETDQLSKNVKTIKQLQKSRKYTLFMKIKQLSVNLTEMNQILGDLTQDSSKIDKDFKDEARKKTNDLLKRVKEFGTNIATSQECHGKGIKKTANFVEDIIVKDICDEEDCCICDLCKLSEQYLVLSDRSNCCLKLVNLKSKNLLDRLALKRTPEGVTKITDSRIAMVQLYEKNEKNESRSIIQFLKLTNAKQLVFMKRFILTEMYCADIAYIGDEKLVIAMTADYHGKLQIMDFSGRVIRTFDIDEKGESPFQCPYYLNTDIMGNQFYVTDWLNDNIYKMDIDFSYGYSYSPRIWHPLGITTDKDGFIYVCESGTGSIHVYHTDDTKNTDKQVLLKFDDFCPQALLYSASLSKLYVSFDGADRLKVYNIINF